MKIESFNDMIKPNPENLNIFWNERRLIIIALIKSNFNLRKACDLNFTDMNLETYKSMLHVKFNLKIK